MRQDMQIIAIVKDHPELVAAVAEMDRKEAMFKEQVTFLKKKFENELEALRKPMLGLLDEIGETLVGLGKLTVYVPEQTHLTYNPDYGVISLCLACTAGKKHKPQQQPQFITKKIDSVEELMADDEIPEQVKAHILAAVIDEKGQE